MKAHERTFKLLCSDAREKMRGRTMSLFPLPLSARREVVDSVNGTRARLNCLSKIKPAAPVSPTQPGSFLYGLFGLNSFFWKLGLGGSILVGDLRQTGGSDLADLFVMARAPPCCHSCSMILHPQCCLNPPSNGSI